MHRFPCIDKQPGLAQAWLDAIQRDNSGWRPSLRVCSLHFRPEDFVSLSTDTNKARASRNFQNSCLKFRRLKENAVPTIGLGSSGSAEDFYKTKRQNRLIHTKKEEFTIFTDDDPLAKNSDNYISESEDSEPSETVKEPDLPVLSSVELYQLLSENREKLPEGFQLLKFPKVSLIKTLASEAKGLRIEASIEINHDLTYKVFYRNKEVAVPAAPDRIRFLCDTNKIIEAFLKLI